SNCLPAERLAAVDPGDLTDKDRMQRADRNGHSGFLPDNCFLVSYSVGEIASRRLTINTCKKNYECEAAHTAFFRHAPFSLRSPRLLRRGGGSCSNPILGGGARGAPKSTIARVRRAYSSSASKGW